MPQQSSFREFDWTYFFDIDKYNEEVKIRHNCTAMIVIRIREEYLWEIVTFGLISPFLYFTYFSLLYDCLNGTYLYTTCNIL